MHVLHIAASPGKDASLSASTARALLAAYAAHHPDASIETLDVWDADLPAFDAGMIAAKFAVLRAHDATPEQQEQWASAVAISQRFNSADLYVFSLPMWNFGVPYRLKHFIDVVTLPGQNWAWSRQDGYTPLLHNKRAVLVYTSAGDYLLEAADRPGATQDGDFQKPYMRRWLRFVGIDVVGEIALAPTLAAPEQLALVREHSLQQARLLAAQL